MQDLFFSLQKVGNDKYIIWLLCMIVCGREGMGTTLYKCIPSLAYDNRARKYWILELRDMSWQYRGLPSSQDSLPGSCQSDG